MQLASYSLGSAFVAALTWRNNCASLWATANAIQVAFIKKRIGELSDGSTLLVALNTLPRHYQERLLLSPECFKLLTSGTRGKDLRHVILAAFIAAAQKRGGRRAIVAEYFRDTPEDSEAQEREYCEYNGNDESVVLPSGISDSVCPVSATIDITLDGYGALGRQLFPEKFGNNQPLTPLEFVQARARLTAGFQRIHSIMPNAAALLTTCVRVIAVAKLSKSPNMIMSTSRIDCLGMMALGNLQSDQWTRARIMDSLVHEGIHCALFKLELLFGLLSDYKLAERLAVVSPWSGRTLPLAAFVHACFVWFGLWSFWSSLLGEEPGADERFYRAQNGFAAGCPLGMLERSAINCIAPEVRALIELMSDEVAGSLRHVEDHQRE